MQKLRIKEICKAKGIAINALAESVGVSRTSVSCIISGRQKPSFDTLEKIAAALGVSVGDLFARSEGVITCPHCGKEITLHADKD